MGKTGNNRWKNLREVTHQVNKENGRKARSDNVSGLLGVSYQPTSGKFRAQIYTNGRMISLGSYASGEAAHAAYVRAKRKLHKGNTL